MIQRAPDPHGPEPPRSPEERPWAFAALWSTGPDPRRDRVFRLQALRRRPGDAGGGWETFDAFARPFDGSGDGAGDEPAATRRMAQEYGVRGADVAQAPPAEEVWPALADFLAGCAVIVLDRADFAQRARSLCAGGADVPDAIGLFELAELLSPGRLARLGEGLVDELVPRSGAPRRAVGPRELRAALGALVGGFLELHPAAVALAARGYRAAAEELAVGGDAPAARALLRALELCAAPRAWSDAGDELFPVHPGLAGERLRDALAEFADPADALAVLTPAWTRPQEEPPALPTEPEDPRPLDRDDERRLDEIFQHHLPRLFGGTYRRGQHDVARAVGRGLGTGEILLVHAPTGTGKTLAYLVPAALWAVRNNVRLGVATFTRALQEQAMDREVPLALELLRRAELPFPPRVSVLKGRHNYLCWRALEQAAPGAGDGGAAWWAWTRTALFALTDRDGDLDRYPRRTEVPFGDSRAAERELARLVRRARAESGCCRHKVDRATCGAETARRRAERSHVVLTNHALALSRQDLFKVVVFDECEHLHEQAHAAWSHVLGIPRLRDLVGSLCARAGGRARALDRVREAALRGSDARASAERCAELQGAVLDSLVHLERAVAGFKGWREGNRGLREERDMHSLFREYARSERGLELREVHGLLAAAWNELTVELAQLAEVLETVPVRGRPRLRRSLDLARADLEESLQGIEAWLPRGEDGPAFRPETFYDVETDDGGRDALAARVLLPHEYLGRYYFPGLFGAVCISATTMLGGSFEAQSAYLGLTRAANPAPEEEREPSVVRTCRAPSPFDHRRILLAVPRDAPHFQSASKAAFLDYTRRFVRDLAAKTRGRMLVLFTNAADCTACGAALVPWFEERGIPFWYQRMEGADKEELAELFRSRTDSVLFGLDTFWYGADFPGETLEYLVIVRLPYGVPDRYHHAQCAALGAAEQRRTIYMPRALAKLRQGFGRLMRTETDKGCVFVLDGRILDPRHRAFLRVLPVDTGLRRDDDESTARFVRGDTEHCVREALAHMGMLADVRRREAEGAERSPQPEPPPAPPEEPWGPPAIAEEDIPF